MRFSFRRRSLEARELRRARGRAGAAMARVPGARPLPGARARVQRILGRASPQGDLEKCETPLEEKRGTPTPRPRRPHRLHRPYRRHRLHRFLDPHRHTGLTHTAPPALLIHPALLLPPAPPAQTTPPSHLPLPGATGPDGPTGPTTPTGPSHRPPQRSSRSGHTGPTTPRPHQPHRITSFFFSPDAPRPKTTPGRARPFRPTRRTGTRTPGPRRSALRTPSASTGPWPRPSGCWTRAASSSSAPTLRVGSRTPLSAELSLPFKIKYLPCFVYYFFAFVVTPAHPLPITR